MENEEKGRNGHDPKEVATGCILKVGFNQTYDSIEAYLKESETFKDHFDDIPGHSVIHRGMKKLTTRYIRKVTNRIICFLKRKQKMLLWTAADSARITTASGMISELKKRKTTRLPEITHRYRY